MRIKSVTLGEISNSDFRMFRDMKHFDESRTQNLKSLPSFVWKHGVPHFIIKIEESIYHKVPVKTLSKQADLFDAIKMIGEDDIALVKDEENNFIGYVTKHLLCVHMLDEYEKLNKFTNVILDTIDDSCTVIDQDRKVLYWTKGAEEIFDIKRDKIVGKPITNFFKKEHLVILKTLEKGEKLKGHQHFAREDLIVLINASPIIHKEKIVGAVVSETDVTNIIRLSDELYRTSEKLFNLEEQLRKTSVKENPFSLIKGTSDKIKQTINISSKAAQTDANILILGESGVGKEVFAKAIHYAREKEYAPFIAINCGAISSTLFESEIFGYEKGAFSGADERGKKGKAELAQGGTLFLDEIGEMPLDMQVKLLRLLQEKKFYRVGGTEEVTVDFRIIAATNRNLFELVQEGKFREDLYYRLSVVHLTVPPLRERPQDIIELAHYFLYEMSIKYNRPINEISQNVMQILLNHSWPGNVRELKNVVERMVVFSDSDQITSDNLPNEFDLINNKSESFLEHTEESTTLKERLEKFEKEIIKSELKKVGGNKLLCAENLGVSRVTLYNRMKRLKIDY